MPIHSFQRTASWALVLLATGCTFNPTLTGPMADADAGDETEDAGPADASDEDAKSEKDASGATDASADLNTDARLDVGRDQGVDQGVDMTAVDAGRDMTVGPAMCDGRLVDLRVSEEHCGECDHPCDPVHGTCTDGSCQCAMGGTPCGDENTCTDIDFDPNNCGDCGRICAPGEVCLNGDCFCRRGLTRCNGECVDTDNDPRHCGTCGNDCNGKSCLDGECDNRNNCPLGTWNCETSAGNACIRGRESDLHCRPTLTDACGTTCQGDEICYDAGFLDAPSCLEYRPGLGCTECPCADCRDGEFCYASDDFPGVAFCVSE